MAASSDEFLTVAEVASILRLNQQTVRNYIDRGELPAVRVGSRRVRVRRSDLDSLLQASGTSSTQAVEAEALDELRDELAQRLRDAKASVRRDGELAAALRALAKASERLAEALESRGVGR